MSAKLIKAVASGKVVIQKTQSGEIQVLFNNGVSLAIHNGDPVELTKITGVSAQDCLQSNLERLITMRAIDVLL